MKLVVQRGVVGLDDPVDLHLPGRCPASGSASPSGSCSITRPACPTHDTGSSNWAKKAVAGGALALVSGHGLRFLLGSKDAYSNSNYVTPGDNIAERHYGKPFPQILADELFGPLNMTLTRYCEDEDGANGQAMLYIRDGDHEDVCTGASRTALARAASARPSGTLPGVNRALHGEGGQRDADAQMTTPRARQRRNDTASA